MKLTNGQRWGYSVLLSAITQAVITIVLLFFMEGSTAFYFIPIFISLFIIAFVPFMLFYRGIFAVVALANQPAPRHISLQDLPVKVSSFEDIEALARCLGQDTLGNKNKFTAALGFMGRGQHLYFICATTIKINNTGDPNVITEPGVMYISDKHIAFVRNSGQVAEFPFEDIHSVSVENHYPKMTFCTATQYIEFGIVYNEKSSAVLRHLFIKPDKTAQDTTTGQAARVIECPGCTATMLVRPGEASQCEYCGRHVD